MVINVKHGRASESRDGRDSVRCRPARRAVTPAALFFAAMLAAAFGCRRGEPQAAESSPQEQPAEATPKVTQYPDEIYGDREIFKEPRIQFVWSPSEDDRRTIWSMKLDGSDVRQAVGRALLFSGDAKVLANYVVPVRSPDGRYIACAGKDGNGDEFRFLVDLKEKKVRTMMKAGSAADYNWTPDSRRVIFYGDLSLHQYEVPTGKLSEFPMIPSEGLHLVDQGRRFVAVEDKTITYYDASGKRLKRVPLPFTADRHHAVSPDGRRLALTVGTGRVIVDIDQIDKPLHREENWYLYSAFSLDNQVLYYFKGVYLRSLDLSTWKDTELAVLTGQTPAYMSMIHPQGKR